MNPPNGPQPISITAPGGAGSRSRTNGQTAASHRSSEVTRHSLRPPGDSQPAPGAVIPSVVVAAHRLPASEPSAGPRRGGDEDKGLRLAGFFVMCSFALAGRRGPARREEMTMTSNK